MDRLGRLNRLLMILAYLGLAIGLPMSLGQGCPPATTPPPNNRSVNSVRVTIGRTEARGNPLSLFFARVMGHESADAVGHYDESLELEEIDPPTRTTLVD